MTQCENGAFLKKIFIVIQLQFYAFSPHPSTPPQLLFRDLLDRSNSDIPRGQGFYGISKLIQPSSVVAGPRFSQLPLLGSCWFSRLPTTRLGRGGRIRADSSAKIFVVLTKFQLFFLNKHSLDCCKSLGNFRILKKLILTIFASVLSYYFHRKAGFHRS